MLTSLQNVFSTIFGTTRCSFRAPAFLVPRLRPLDYGSARVRRLLCSHLPNLRHSA